MYKAYTGPAGPTKEQSETNTKTLGQELKKLKIPFKEDREYSKELYDEDDLNLKIENVLGEIIYVGYDRWGFVVDGDIGLDVDQENLTTTISIIKKWFESRQTCQSYF